MIFFHNFGQISEFSKISKFLPNFRILTKFPNFNRISKFRPNLKNSTKFKNFDQISDFWPIFRILNTIRKFIILAKVYNLWGLGLGMYKCSTKTRDIGKSIPDARDIFWDPRYFPRAKPEGNLGGGGVGFSNTSRVLVEYGHSLIIKLSTGSGSENPSLWTGKDWQCYNQSFPAADERMCRNKKNVEIEYGPVHITSAKFVFFRPPSSSIASICLTTPHPWSSSVRFTRPPFPTKNLWIQAQSLLVISFQWTEMFCFVLALHSNTKFTCIVPFSHIFGCHL